MTDASSPVPIEAAPDSRLGVPWTLIAVRVPVSLKLELEAVARHSRRSLSAEMRLRLHSNGGGDQLRLVMAAVRARVPHELIEQLIHFWEGT
jgi:hypothetical protein